MFRVGVGGNYTARHFLIGDFGEESTPHEHRYDVRWILETGKLDENGFSVDIALLESIIETCLDRYDGVLMNDLPWFKGKQPSVENTAMFLTEEIFSRLQNAETVPGNLLSSELQVFESPTSWASYRIDGEGIAQLLRL
ncbi:MAG: 6-carboxytetrahydropterin synthase [Spirochaetales bacterium]|nr:6-carboxytetrahydropterin synthase [Spirochaetales bacterium]MCF7938049.1 6-carboxytetrahydropterin synthase [Spirochaetales bacterium]